MPPEHLLKAIPLQILFTLGCERMLVERIDDNLLYRWFVVLVIDDPVWDHSTFSANRERLFNEGKRRKNCCAGVSLPARCSAASPISLIVLSRCG